MILIQAYNDGLAGVRAGNPDVHLSLGRDPSVSEEHVLRVEYPSPTKDPAGRDVQCAAEHQDWTAGRAIVFQIKPTHPVKLSLSFTDRNRVAYTAGRELKGGVWQLVRIPFDEIRPNPFFQPPDAKTGAPLDVSEVKGIAFAPHDLTSGVLAIGKFVVSKESLRNPVSSASPNLKAMRALSELTFLSDQLGAEFSLLLRDEVLVALRVQKGIGSSLFQPRVFFLKTEI